MVALPVLAGIQIPQLPQKPVHVAGRFLLRLGLGLRLNLRLRPRLRPRHRVAGESGRGENQGQGADHQNSHGRIMPENRIHGKSGPVRFAEFRGLGRANNATTHAWARYVRQG